MKIKWPCRICGGLFDEGFYAQHRVLPEHLTLITHRQGRYGGPTVFCDRCGEPYPPGTYGNHRLSDTHLANTKWGTRALERMEGMKQMARRDAFILSRLRLGDSYGELAKELGISRQRVHQIAKSNNATSIRTAGKAPVVTVAKTCFYDGKLYTEWSKHVTTIHHQTAVAEITAQIARVKRT
jgi:hypothetical protein